MTSGVRLVEVEGHEVLVVVHKPADGGLHALREGHGLVVGLEDGGAVTLDPRLTPRPEEHGCKGGETTVIAGEFLLFLSL